MQLRLRAAHKRRQIEQQKAQERQAQQQSHSTRAQIENQMAAREEQELSQRPQNGAPAAPMASAVSLTDAALPNPGTVAPPSMPAGLVPRA